MPIPRRVLLVLRERLLPAVALVDAGVAGPATTLHAVRNDRASFDGAVHFAGVGVSAATAAAAAVALRLVGARCGDGRTILVGAAFTLMTGLLAVHGLATPGILIGQNGVVSLTGAATFPPAARCSPWRSRTPPASPSVSAASPAAPRCSSSRSSSPAAPAGAATSRSRDSG